MDVANSTQMCWINLKSINSAPKVKIQLQNCYGCWIHCELVGALTYVDDELDVGLVDLFKWKRSIYRFAPTDDAFYAICCFGRYFDYRI
jgi:hypothetical protein